MRARLTVAVLLLAGVAACGSPDPVPAVPEPPLLPTTGSATATPAPSTATAPATSAVAVPGPAPTRGGPGPARRPAAARWKPRPGLTWQWQLSGPVDRSVAAAVYDVDGAETSAATVAALHAAGKKVICYVNAGASEEYRADRGRFPAAVLGRNDGWPDERWLDIRQLATLRPIMTDRFRQCADKGFDAVEPDNVEAYTNDSGFPLTAAHQLAFNRMLAEIAHGLGLSIGLKNDLEQVPQLVDVFDFAVNEQCFEFDECRALSPFIARGKAVFHVEYDVPTSEFCPTTRALGFSSMRKPLELGSAREYC